MVAEKDRPDDDCIEALCRPRCHHWREEEGCLMVGMVPADNVAEGPWLCAQSTHMPPVPSDEALEWVANLLEYIGDTPDNCIVEHPDAKVALLVEGVLLDGQKTFRVVASFLRSLKETP